LPKDDKSVPDPEGFMNFMIGAARSVEPTAMDVVETIDGGHCVMISRPKEVADILRRAAGEDI
jgi:hypothetical protein